MLDPFVLILCSLAGVTVGVWQGIYHSADAQVSVVKPLWWTKMLHLAKQRKTHKEYCRKLVTKLAGKGKKK
jgi:hypothetical protein